MLSSDCFERYEEIKAGEHNFNLAEVLECQCVSLDKLE